jgi:hypothetical protein
LPAMAGMATLLSVTWVVSAATAGNVVGAGLGAAEPDAAGLADAPEAAGLAEAAADAAGLADALAAAEAAAEGLAATLAGGGALAAGLDAMDAVPPHAASIIRAARDVPNKGR